MTLLPIESALACSTNPDLFFAESPEDVTRAKALCRDCPVRAGGGWSLCLILQAAGVVEGALLGWCAVRRHRERLDRLWPRLRLVLEPLAG